MTKALAMLGFEMILSQRNLLHKVVFNAVRDVHHTPLVGKEMSSILLGKDIILESRIIQI